MRHKIFAFIIPLITFYTVCKSQPGTLDKSFGEKGTIVAYGSDYLYSTDMIIQPDGKIDLLARTDWPGCNYENCGNTHVYIWNPDGSLYNIIYPYNHNNNANRGDKIVIQKDGKLIIAGSSFFGEYQSDWENTFSELWVTRVNVDGSIDSSFADNGFFVRVLDSTATAFDMALQSDGKILVATTGHYREGYDTTLIRLNSDGSVDSTFGDNSALIVGKCSISVQDDDKVLVASTIYSNEHSHYEFEIKRYTKDGKPDNSFGIDGKINTAFKKSDAFLSSSTITDKGEIIAYGSAIRKDTVWLALVRYNTNGSIDKSFGTNGQVLYYKDNYSWRSISVHPDGKILVGGINGQSWLQHNGAVLQINNYGSVDSSFGSNGIAPVVLPDGLYFSISNLSIQKDLKIICSGGFYDGNEDVVGLALVRLNGDGAYFAVSSKLSYIGNEISFTDESSYATSWQWDFDGDGIFDSEIQNPQHAYSEGGTYQAKLRIDNDPSSEKVIPITILPNRGTPYLTEYGGDFETYPNDFAADSIGNSGFRRGISAFYGKDGTHSGNNAWIIDPDQATYSSNSTAYLYSPSYNCTAMGNYTFSFYAKYAVENTWDGFRVEYSTDKGNNWQILGNVVQVNWYDYNNADWSLGERPFPQNEAYFSNVDAVSYVQKIFTTNAIQGNPSVAFRIVFKADPFVEDAGMAIDDISLTGPTNVVLPVTIISLNGTNNGSNNLLNWKSATEQNSLMYVVERSLDGRNFSSAGIIKSMNSATGYSYHYNDDISHIYSNNFYYRLKILDDDGKYNYSNVVAIIVSNRNEKIALLNNITNSYLIVLAPSAMLQKTLHAEIISSSGNAVKNLIIASPSTPIYVTNFSAGKYYIRFIQNGRIIQTEQFVKQ